MKIAFWSSAKGSIGVTSNLACISIATAIEHSCKSILIENHYQKNKLGNILKYHQANLVESFDKDQFGQIGMNHIFKELSKGYGYEFVKNPMDPLIKDTSQTRWNTTEIIRDASLEILDNYLYYIPTGNQMNREIFDYTLNDNIKNILDASEAYADITYIDTSNENNLSSKIILEEVDLVVVNLIQNSAMIKYFFNNYSSIINKSVFLISSYNKNSSFNIKYISKQYSINKSNIAVIPYNDNYQEAVSQGSLVEFLTRNYYCKRKNPNYEFIHEVQRAVLTIFNKTIMIP